MKRDIIIYTFIVFFGLSFLQSCEDPTPSIDPNSLLPKITFAFDSLEADLNLVDNLPIVAVVQSEAGLKSVDMIIKTGSEDIHYKTVTEFFNEHSYSLAEKVQYKPEYLQFVVEATDKLDRKTVASLELSIIDIKEGPKVIFEPEMIVYDELEGGPMPNTKFTVTSEAGLLKLEMYLVTENGQMQYGFPIDFTQNENEYIFDEKIMYKEGDKGFKVKVTDSYGQVRIETLPVRYITPAPPTVLVKDTIFADKDERVAIPLKIESQRGIRSIEIFRADNNVFESVETINYPDAPLTLNVIPEVKCLNTTSKIKFAVTDVVDKTTEVSVTAIVNMNFIAKLAVGSMKLANGIEAYPGVYSFISLKDLKTYSVDYALESDENASNVDMKFYVFGGQAVLRMYSMDGGTNTKNNEFLGSGGKTAMDVSVQNQTRFLLLNGYDFDSATAASILSDIPASNIVANAINPFEVGDVIAFKTASTSSSGGGKIGIMKILSNEQVISIDVTARIITVAIKFPKQ
ncbi:MAG: hypothetical protein ACOX7E_04070 [Paludibacter sp.]|jgi:hypothetical protein